MTSARVLAAGMAAAWLATTQAPNAAQTPAAGSTAGELVRRVLDGRGEGGFRARAMLTRMRPGTEPDTRQLLIRGRRESSRAVVLYEQLWPSVEGRRVVVIETTGQPALAGFRLEAGRASRLTGDDLDEPFLDSGLTLEDLAGLFWFWPTRSASDEEDIGTLRTVAVEFLPAGIPSSYSMARAWISPELALGLRVELFDRTSAPVKVIGLHRPLRFGNRWVPSIMTVDPAGTSRSSRTVLEGVSLEADDAVTFADLTLEAVVRGG